jgi:hypothetical protein
MKSGYLFFFLALIIINCSRGDKIDISTISIDREISVNHDLTQTTDSIIIYKTKKIISSSGDSVYNITTKSEKRKRDSLIAADTAKIPGSFAPETNHFTYSLTSAVNFSVIIYDSSGTELVKLVDGKFSKGSYEVYFAVYSVLKPGLYYAVVYHQSADQYFKLTIK